jgi:hypothetical protein
VVLALFEWCADMFGVTRRARITPLLATCAALFVFALVLGLRWGAIGALLPVMLFLGAGAVAWAVMRARDRVWRAACAPIAELDAAVDEAPGPLLPRTADALEALARAVTDARLERYDAAWLRLSSIDRELLRPEEVHLLEAVRAIVSLGLGDPHRAAQQAAVALPTGSDDLDAHLGRTLVADAWSDRARLRATLTAWNRVGVGGSTASPLGRLEKLVRVRIEPRDIERVSSADARALADEARLLGDEDLATELDARARTTAYR